MRELGKRLRKCTNKETRIRPQLAPRMEAVREGVCNDPEIGHVHQDLHCTDCHHFWKYRTIGMGVIMLVVMFVWSFIMKLLVVMGRLCCVWNCHSVYHARQCEIKYSLTMYMVYLHWFRILQHYNSPSLLYMAEYHQRKLLLHSDIQALYISSDPFCG